jgi:hypothetical protein
MPGLGPGIHDFGAGQGERRGWPAKASHDEEERMSDLRIEDAVNETCPWSGKPVAADALTLYKGAVVGFCNPGCRDKFERAVRHFEDALQGHRADSAQNSE